MVLHPLAAIHLCSGYGGFELGFKLAGMDIRSICHIERDAYAAATLVARMEDQTLDQAPIWSDLLTFDGKPWSGRVDLITAGFPCQPFSNAGSKRGVDDDRWLWPDIFRIICEVGPRIIYLENVPQLVKHGLAYILSDLASVGWDAEWGLLSAAELGAPHHRERCWILACEGLADASIRRRFQGSDVIGGVPSSSGEWASGNAVRSSADGGRGLPRDTWPPARGDYSGWQRWLKAGGPKPSIRRITNGRPQGLADELHLGGNGLVPAVAAEALAELATRLGVGKSIMNENINPQ